MSENYMGECKGPSHLALALSTRPDGMEQNESVLAHSRP